TDDLAEINMKKVEREFVSQDFRGECLSRTARAMEESRSPQPTGSLRRKSPLLEHGVALAHLKNDGVERFQTAIRKHNVFPMCLCFYSARQTFQSRPRSVAAGFPQ